MKCEATRNLILLDQSGELSAFGRWRLTRHIGACAGCRSYRDDLARITTAARSSAAVEDAAGAGALERIRAAARRANSRSEEIRFRPSRQSWAEMWQPALLYSTLSVALAVGFLLIARPFLRPGVQMVVQSAPAVADANSWDSGFDDRISELDDLVANVSSEWTAETDDVDSMARELIDLEEQKI